MIQSFGDRETEKFYHSGKSKKIPQGIQSVALRKLDYLNASADLDDLRIPPGNRLEALSGTLAGYYSIRINKQYRLMFRYRNGNAYDVSIIGYH